MISLTREDRKQSNSIEQRVKTVLRLSCKQKSSLCELFSLGLHCQSSANYVHHDWVSMDLQVGPGGCCPWCWWMLPVWWVCVFLSELTGGSRARCGWITVRRKEPKHVSSSSSSSRISNKHGDISYCSPSLSPGRTNCLLPDNSRWAGCQPASEEVLRGHFVGEQLVDAFVHLTEGVLASAS